MLIAPFVAAWYVTRGRMRLARWLAYSACAALVILSAYPVAVIVVEEMQRLADDQLVIDGAEVMVMRAETAASLPNVPHSDLIISKANEYGIDPAIALGLAEYESGFDATAVSYAGAAGLLQLMPGTAAELGVMDPFDPAQNVDGGMRYLRDRLAQFNGDYRLALAAYHGGPGRTSSGGERPIDTHYATVVMSNAEKYRGMLAVAPQQPQTAGYAAVSPETIIMPYDDYILTQGVHGQSYGHLAIDIKAGKGVTIKSPIEGTVTQLFTDGIGNPTLVIENNVYEVVMLHGVYTVSVGDVVAIGQPVGTESNLGNTRDAWGNSCRGRDCGFHTHLNVFDKRLGKNVNPLEVIR